MKQLTGSLWSPWVSIALWLFTQRSPGAEIMAKRSSTRNFKQPEWRRKTQHCLQQPRQLCVLPFLQVQSLFNREVFVYTHAHSIYWTTVGWRFCTDGVFAIIVSVLQNPTIEGLLSFSMFVLQFIALYLQVIFFGKKMARSFFFFLLALLKYDVSACTELTATEVMTLWRPERKWLARSDFLTFYRLWIAEHPVGVLMLPTLIFFVSCSSLIFFVFWRPQPAHDPHVQSPNSWIFSSSLVVRFCFVLLTLPFVLLPRNSPFGNDCVTC